MGNAALAQDFLDAVRDVLSEVGDTKTFRIVTESAIDINNPGAAPTPSNEDVALEAFLFDFIQEYMPEANVIEGDKMAILSVIDLSSAQIEAIKPGEYLIDGLAMYTIVRTKPVKVAGETITVFVQLKG